MPEKMADLFQHAVASIDTGDVSTLNHMLTAHPELAVTRLEEPGAWLRDRVGVALDGFFARPYLLWFVAEDPVRNGKLPGNIAEVTQAIIDAARRQDPGALQGQLDHALLLVGWSWIASECGVQLALIDVLIDAGANPDGVPNNALVDRNHAAAAHLIKRGAKVTLAAALCLGMWDEADRLITSVGPAKKQFALTLTALNGHTEAVRRLIEAGVDINGRCPDLYGHATPLHHAVCSGSLATVRLLADAGANLDDRDAAEDATPLGWAEYLTEGRKGEYEAIRSFLTRQGARPLPRPWPR